MSTNIPFYYRVSIRLQKSKNHLTGEQEIEEIQQDFKNPNPIEARKNAISFFESYLETILEARKQSYKSIEDAADKLVDLISPSTTTQYENGMLLKDSFDKKCCVELIINSPIEDESVGEIYRILELDNYQQNGEDLIDNLMRLQLELNYYDHYCLSKEDYETSEVVYDRDDYDTQSYPFLKIPIDWSSKNLMGNLEEREDAILQLIAGGESHLVEFKPSLVFNDKTGKGDIFRKNIIAKAICSFANSNDGGILFIGIDDDAGIIGLENSDFILSEKLNPKDYFWQEFQQMQDSNFQHSIANLLERDFLKIDDKSIFVVKIRPSTVPIFTKHYDHITKTSSKKFFYRDGSSSKEIKDIEEIVTYCIDRFSAE